jgi:flotillin
MTVEEIYQDRKKFSRSVFEVASTDLLQMGIVVISYTLKDIKDDQGYLYALGMKRTSQVQAEARIGQAAAKMQSGIREAEAEEVRLKAEFENKSEVARAQRDFQLNKHAYDMEVNTKKAVSTLAYELQSAITKQKIKEEDMQIKVVERAQQINLQNQEIIRRERELDATVRKPAEAEKYKLEKLAHAYQQKVVLEAEAEAQAIQVRGEAEAFAIEAKAKAEAEQMAKKADAWRDYQDAAMIDMLLETLPKVAAEIAAPLAKVNKITMVSSGSQEVGAAKITRELMDIVLTMPDAMAKLTGVNIADAIGKKN